MFSDACGGAYQYEYCGKGIREIHVGFGVDGVR